MHAARAESRGPGFAARHTRPALLLCLGGVGTALVLLYSEDVRVKSAHAMHYGALVVFLQLAAVCVVFMRGEARTPPP